MSFSSMWSHTTKVWILLSLLGSYVQHMPRVPWSPCRLSGSAIEPLNRLPRTELVWFRVQQRHDCWHVAVGNSVWNQTIDALKQTPKYCFTAIEWSEWITFHLVIWCVLMLSTVVTFRSWKSSTMPVTNVLMFLSELCWGWASWSPSVARCHNCVQQQRSRGGCSC